MWGPNAVCASTYRNVCGRKGAVCMLVLIMPLAPGGFWLSLIDSEVSGGNLDGGVADGLSLLLGLGYKF